MKQSFLASTAAAALLASITFAAAQTPGGKNDSQSAGPAKSDSAAPSKIEGAPDKSEGAAPQPRAQSRPSAPGAAQNSAAPNAGSSAQREGQPSMQRSESPSSARPGAASSDTKADVKSSAGTSSPSGAASNDATKSAPTGAATNSSAPANRSASVGAPPAEKRTQIISVIKQEKVQPVTSVNFNISVGTVVPSSVRYHPLPRRIIEIYPEWAGFEFILVNGRYIIIRPETREIIYIIEA